MKSKRAISPMVSYVLLIVIAISLSVVVYSYLKLYLPGSRPECPSDLNLIIESAHCFSTNQTLTVQISNRGLFNISDAFVRLGLAGKLVKAQANENRERLEGGPFSPGDFPRTYVYNISHIIDTTTSAEYTIEIQPAIREKGALYPCVEAIVNQDVMCDRTPLPPTGACSNGETRDCPLTQGVCSEAPREVCVAQEWPGCTSGDYGPDYEQGQELTCTGGLDNDCDGDVDCSDPDCLTDAACQGLIPSVAIRIDSGVATFDTGIINIALPPTILNLSGSQITEASQDEMVQTSIEVSSSAPLNCLNAIEFNTRNLTSLQFSHRVNTASNTIWWFNLTTSEVQDQTLTDNFACT